MFFLLQQPVVVELNKTQETSRITYPDVIVSAFGVALLIMLVAILFGLAAGWMIIYRKRRAEADRPSDQTDHVTLRI